MDDAARVLARSLDFRDKLRLTKDIWEREREKTDGW